MLNNEDPSLTKARAQMVEQQLASRFITDSRVLEAMEQIPRHHFVDKELWNAAYKDRPLPIGYGQTISQPYIVAFMTQALQLPQEGQTVVLEIGTGSGYQAAILSRLATRVYSIERIEPLAQKARQRLEELGITNVHVEVRDGTKGWPEHAPYDGILVTAAAPEIPNPLTTQLKPHGRLVGPAGPRWQQQLVRLQRRGGKIEQEPLAPVAFVPLIGEHGWQEEDKKE